MASIALLLATAYGGMVFGYLLGGPQFSSRMAKGDIALTLSALQRLRNENIDESIPILESQLDTLIVLDCSLDPWIEGWLGIIIPENTSENTKLSAKLMNRVAEYRKRYPSRLDPLEVCKKFSDHHQSNWLEF